MKNIEFAPGALKPNILPLSYEFGGMTPVGEELLFPSGSITEFLPPEKFQQSAVYFDTYGCVSHSMINGFQTLIHKQLAYMSPPNKAWLLSKVYEKDYPYFSHRDLVVLSETKHGTGNSGDKVLATAEREGLVVDSLAPWDMRNRNPEENTVQKYYLYGRTKEAQAFADEFNSRFKLHGEWVAQAKWKEASKYGVLQIYVNAWHKNAEGKYYNPTSKINHAVLLEDYEKKLIFDSYEPHTKEMVSWDDTYMIGLKLNIIEKHMEKLNIPNNSLVILVEGVGGIGLFLDNNIIIDEPAKINSVFMARNSKNNFFSGGPTISLTQEQWDSFRHTNLKGEEI